MHRYDLIPARALERLALRYGKGAEAHGEHNFRKGMPASVIYRHLMRHLQLWKRSDDNDDHLAAIAWGIFTLMEWETYQPDQLDLFDMNYQENLEKLRGRANQNAGECDE